MEFTTFLIFKIFLYEGKTQVQTCFMRYVQIIDLSTLICPEKGIQYSGGFLHFSLLILVQKQVF